jgi:hypothetical protein
MKKVLIAAVALVMAASISLAGMGITWSAGGWMAEYGGDLSEGPGVADNNAVLWQLIYAGADNVANEPDLSASTYLSGDDELLADRTIAQGGGKAADGTEWDSWLQPLSGTPKYEDLTWTTDGYLYQRIWQGTPSEKDGGKYFETGLLKIDTAYATGSAAQSFYYDSEGNGVAVDKVIDPAGQVPEPATMSLLGLGALAMVLRRKLSK